MFYNSFCLFRINIKYYISEFYRAQRYLNSEVIGLKKNIFSFSGKNFRKI